MSNQADPFDFLGVEWADNRCVRAEDFEQQESSFRSLLGWLAVRAAGCAGKVLRLRTETTADALVILAADVVCANGVAIHVDAGSTGPITVRGSDLSGSTTRSYDLLLVATDAVQRLDEGNDDLGLCARRRPRPALVARPLKDHHVDPDACIVVFPGENATAVKMKAVAEANGEVRFHGSGDGRGLVVAAHAQVRLGRLEVLSDHRLRRLPEVLPRAARIVDVDWVQAGFEACLRELQGAHERLGEQQDYQTNKLWERRLLTRWYELFLQVFDVVRDTSRTPEEVLAAYRQFYRQKNWSIEEAKKRGDNVFPQANFPEHEATMRAFLMVEPSEDLGVQLQKLANLLAVDCNLTRQIMDLPMYFLLQKENPPATVTLRQRRYKLYHHEEVDPNRITTRGGQRSFLCQPKAPPSRDVSEDLVMILRTDFQEGVEQGNCQVRMVYKGEEEENFEQVLKRRGNQSGVLSGHSYHFVVSPPAASRHSLANLHSVEFVSDPTLIHLKLYFYHRVRDQEIVLESIKTLAGGHG